MAFSTVKNDNKIVINKFRIIGNQRYIKSSIFMQDSGCVSIFATYPLAAKSHPNKAVPIPLPIFTPREEHEYIVPSILFPVVANV